MSDANFEAELERRIALLEDPASDEQVLENLPLADVLWAVAAVVVMGIALLIWGYPR